MTDRHLPRELLQDLISKDFRNQPHALDVGEVLPIGGSNARRLLPAMLQRIQAEIRHPRRISMPVNGNNAALLVQLVALMVCHPARAMSSGDVEPKDLHFNSASIAFEQSSTPSTP